MNRPNVVFLHSHNTGTFVQPYGHAVPTPNLQKLAEQGVTFRKAFATAPTCSPSRASFLSGMYPHSAGMLGLAHRGFSMNDPAQHIVNVLKTNGYITALSGVEHTFPDLSTVGYDRVVSSLDTNYQDTIDQPDEAEGAEAFLSEKHDRPFFLSVGLNETHRPFPKADPETNPSEDARYSIAPSPLPDTPETREDTADYKAAARIMDEKYGRVLRALDEHGLQDNTLVFCFADHGLQFPRNMCNLTDHGSQVYLIARGPGGFTGGKVVDALVSLIDLVPTVYELAGIGCPDFVDGTSLTPLINGTEGLHDHVFCEVNYHAAYEPMRSVRTERYKYIRRYDGREQHVLPNTDDTLSKAFILNKGWEEIEREQEMLYDLMFDPHEANNLAGSDTYTEILTEMQRKLESWMGETNDPLLNSGTIYAPSGSRVNNPDGRSPNEEPHVVP
ncbi:MAG TPA: sulfatase [Candidatus Latescibacteria bacterium]|nr:sulfatase [Candidatus Latescibacterota bacterium]